jgi:hypothetical protein
MSEKAESLWFEVQAKMAEREGVARTLTTIRDELLRTFPGGVKTVAGEDWVGATEEAVRSEGLETVLHRLITQLRVELSDVPPNAVAPVFGYQEYSIQKGRGPEHSR